MSADVRRYLILIVGATLLLLLGLIYAYSVLMAPLKSKFSWSVSGTTLIFTLSMIAFTTGNYIAGRLVRNRGTRFVFMASVIFLLVGFLGSAFAGDSNSLLIIYLFYGIVASIGIGLVYNIIIPTVTSWFPDRAGFAQGICLMGYGFGGFLLGPVVTQIYTIFVWWTVFIAIGIFFSALVFACSFIIEEPSARELDELFATAASGGCAGAAAAAAPADRDVDAGTMIKDPVFPLLYIFLFMLGSIGMGVTGIGRELPLSLGADPLGAAFIIGFVSIGNGIGRLAGGVALDRFGRGRTMVSVSCLFLVAVLTMIVSLLAHSIAIQTLGCLLIGLSWGSTLVTMPFVTRREWGQANMAENMAIVNSYGIFAAVVGSWGAGLLAEATGSYILVLGTMATMALCGIVVALVLERVARREKALRS